MRGLLLAGYCSQQAGSGRIFLRITSRLGGKQRCTLCASACRSAGLLCQLAMLPLDGCSCSICMVPVLAAAERFLPLAPSLPSTAAAGRFLHGGGGGGGGPRGKPMGSEAAPGAEMEAGEAQLRAVAGKMMGDLGTSGDAPFGGEVAMDAESQVGARGVGGVGAVVVGIWAL